ncbi:MAG: adenylate/guanylate cyclase domain-containing protein [Acidimicrobiales bacterium]
MDTSELVAVAVDSRVSRSFAFLDLCGFTVFVDAAGDDAAVAELQHLRASVREVAPLFGVRVEKWLGDGVMLVGVDSEPLVAATVAVQLRFDRPGQLPIRAGIATGEVLLLEGDDYIGRPVNLASRLCDQADRDQILAAVDGLAVPDWVSLDAHDPVRVRGIAQPVEVVAVKAEMAELRRRSKSRNAPLHKLFEGLKLLR